MEWMTNRESDMESPVVKGLLIVFAVIGVLTVLAFLGMAFMHGGMMGLTGSFGTMMSACQDMMARL